MPQRRTAASQLPSGLCFGEYERCGRVLYARAASAPSALRYNPRSMRPLAALLCALLTISSLSAQKKKKEEETQTLRVPEELPSAVTGETRRLAFHTTPLSAKGLLSPQVRDALKALQHEAGGETVLKIRVFVAGTGDLRHVRDLVSEFFAGHKQPLPTIALIKVGALPLEGAQVEFEAIAEAKKDVNPAGVAFISPTVATAEDPLGPVQPLIQKSIAGLRESLAAAKLAPSDAIRITCFVSSLAGLAETRQPRRRRISTRRARFRAARARARAKPWRHARQLPDCMPRPRSRWSSSEPTAANPNPRWSRPRKWC